MKKAIICDLDGTLALKHDGRSWYDASTSDLDNPNEPVLALLRFVQEANWHGLNQEQNCQIIFLSGRQEKDREPTEKFLEKHRLNRYPLFMRTTDDFRNDTIIKKELNNETLRVDTGCLVAFSPGVDYDIQRAGNLKAMFFAGEGIFLTTLSGTGSVYLQSLPFSRLADRILSHAPKAGGKRKGEGSVLGMVGDMIGGD